MGGRKGTCIVAIAEVLWVTCPHLMLINSGKAGRFHVSLHQVISAEFVI